ncbi:Protein FAR1-RELATED SEQUENCE 11, partial [Linum perenne]
MDYHSKIAQAPSRYIKHPHIEQASKFDEDNQTHLDERRVIVNPATADYKCSCRLFDSHGWLCRHILKTMDHVMLWENKDARTIPSKYLKVRWRKTAKVGVDFVIQFGGETDPDSEVSRYHELMSMFSVLALESAPLVETTNMAKQFASDGRDRVRAVILEHHGETITSE